MLKTDVTIDVRRAASRAHTRIDWLDSRHSFSFGGHYDLFWMRGRYTSWLDFGTSIRTRLRADLGRVPDGSFASARQRPREFAFDGAPALRRVWRFGDGSRPVSGERVKHTYERPGRYTVVSTAFGRRSARVRRDVFVREVRAR